MSLPSRLRADIPHLTGKDQKVIDRVVRDLLAEVSRNGRQVRAEQKD